MTGNGHDDDKVALTLVIPRSDDVVTDVDRYIRANRIARAPIRSSLRRPIFSMAEHGCTAWEKGTVPI